MKPPLRRLPSTVWRKARTLFRVHLPRLREDVLTGLRARPKLLPRLRRRWEGRPDELLFHPEHPRDLPWPYTILRICRELGVRPARRTRGAPLRAIHWQDRPVARVDERLRELQRRPGLINGRCRDIRKSTVQRAFETAFGYPLAVDPLTHRGPLVEKSEANGRHDGVVRHGPLPAPEPGKAYERLIDNRPDRRTARLAAEGVEAGIPAGIAAGQPGSRPVGGRFDPEKFVFDHRVPVCGEEIPFVFLKYKPRETRFRLSTGAELTTAEAAFSADERAALLRFCHLLGFDYGELDVLRDAGDGRLYVVDANTTPTLHYVGYTRRQKRWIVRALAAAFDRAFLQAEPGGKPAPGRTSAGRSEDERRARSVRVPAGVDASHDRE